MDRSVGVRAPAGPEEGSSMLLNQLEPRDRQLLRALLVLGVVALALVVGSQIISAFYFFGDIILVFFLAWLIAFVISPVVDWLATRIPGLPTGVATVLVYTLVVVIGLAILVAASAALYSSIDQFIREIPTIRTKLPELVRPYQEWLATLGFSEVDLEQQANLVLANLNVFAGQLVGPLQQVAVASVGILGTLLITFFLSVWMVLDRSQIGAFLFRLIPPAYAEEARVLQTATSRSFGGFLRGQSIMGLSFFFVALVPHLLFGLPLAVLSATTAGVLMAIPFFGPFVSWVPPVLVALVFQPSALLPTAIIMGVGWFIAMNVLQPRIMQGAVGIHPIVVLGSVLITMSVAWFVVMNVISPRLMSGAVGIHPIVVLASVVIGSKVAGIVGAIFGIPIAAVLSAFFFHWFGRSREGGTVADRATQRVAAREQREVRRPREPVPGVDEDVEEVGPGRAAIGLGPEATEGGEAPAR